MLSGDQTGSVSPDPQPLHRKPRKAGLRYVSIAATRYDPMGLMTGHVTGGLIVSISWTPDLRRTSPPRHPPVGPSSRNVYIRAQHPQCRTQLVREV